MEINSQINTFDGGMDLDTDISLLKNNKYRWALNVRILSDNEGTAGSLLNIEDIRLYEGGLDKSEVILGTAVTKYYDTATKKLDDCGVVFTKCVVNSNLINNLWIVRGFDTIKPTWTLIVSAELNVGNKVSIITNYESNSTSNVYITDGDSSIKVINILKKYNTTAETPIEVQSYFDILPMASLVPFTLLYITTGSLKSGTVQYCYLLFNVHGQETVTSPLSSLIPIFSKYYSNSKEVNGDLEDDVITNKGCFLNAKILNVLKFNRIRIFRIRYNKLKQATVEIIDELDLADTENEVLSFSYTDRGTGSLTTLTIEEFNNMIPFEFSAKSIAKMDNRLFASNITENTWDIEYDARAYRCNKEGNVLLKSNTGDISASLSDIVSLDTDLIIPKEHDCINPMNSSLTYPEDYAEEYAYGYDSDNVTRGGKGLNISYRFVKGDLIESDKNTVTDGNSWFSSYSTGFGVLKKYVEGIPLRNPDTGVLVDNLFIDLNIIRNYSDPYCVSHLLGYLRDEVYRFGIVFYNNKNIPSPVHWIGDIRFPSADIEGYQPFTFNDNAENSNGIPPLTGGNELISHPLGISFEVNNLPSEVYAYEIVRCNRTITDRTVMTQGLLNRTLNFSGWSSNGYDGFTSLGNKDRRPAIMPTFAVNSKYARGFYNVSDNKFNQLEQLNLNSLDTDGIFDFVSADICFNSGDKLSIVNSGMKIVPLYCGCSAVYCSEKNNKHYRVGVPFTAYNTITDVTGNPFGGITYLSNHDGDGPSLPTNTEDYGIFDGFHKKGNEISGGVCKYFYTFDKENALGGGSIVPDSYKGRKAFDILDVCNTKNIDPYMSGDIDTIKTNVEYIGNYNYINYAMGSELAYGPHGINVAVYSPDVYNGKYLGVNTLPRGFKYDKNLAANSVLFVNIKRNTVQYGGDSYANRLNSVYISTNTYVNNIVNIIVNNTCFGGDTYLGILDYSHTLLFTKNQADEWNGRKRYIGAYIPLESSVNVYLRADEHFSLKASDIENSVNTGKCDIDYMTEPGTLNTINVQKYKLYSYNSSYSAQGTSKSYIPKSIYSEDDLVSINRIVTSELKTNNELTDSWTKFKFANYLDVDSQYGKITNLKVFKNRLYFFQDQAIGVASVNDRSLIQDNNLGQLVLGTGGILTRADYITILNGSSIVNDKSIVNSENNIYWYDFDKNVICVLGDGFQEISKTRNVLTYLNRLPDSSRKNAVSFYDKKYNEIWFRIYDRALIYNEKLGLFTSFYTHNPNWFFPLSTKVITIKGNNCYYLHNMYDANSQQKEERIAYVRFVVNKDIPNTKVFDNLIFTAETKGDHNNNTPVIFKEITFETTDLITEPVANQNIDYRENTYRLPIGREKQNNPEQQELSNMSYAGRMRGKYLICNYTFDCNSNNDFKLPYLKTTYRYSMI